MPEARRSATPLPSAAAAPPFQGPTRLPPARSTTAGPVPVPTHAAPAIVPEAKPVQGPAPVPRPAAPRGAAAVVTFLALAGVALVVNLYYHPATRRTYEGTPFAPLLVMLTMGLLATALSWRVLSLLSAKRWALLASLLGLAGGALAFIDVRAGASRLFPTSWAFAFYGLGALLVIGIPALLALKGGDAAKRRRDRIALSFGLYASVSYTLLAVLALGLGTR